jgi:hypothetical protein
MALSPASPTGARQLNSVSWTVPRRWCRHASHRAAVTQDDRTIGKFRIAKVARNYTGGSFLSEFLVAKPRSHSASHSTVKDPRRLTSSMIRSILSAIPSLELRVEGVLLVCRARIALCCSCIVPSMRCSARFVSFSTCKLLFRRRILYQVSTGNPRKAIG